MYIHTYSYITYTVCPLARS